MTRHCLKIASFSVPKIAIYGRFSDWFKNLDCSEHDFIKVYLLAVMPIFVKFLNDKHFVIMLLPKPTVITDYHAMLNKLFTFPCRRETITDSS